MAWTDDKREAVIAEYQEIMNDQYETDAERAGATVEVVAQLAEKYGETVNGVRNVLNRAQVYIKKAATASASSSSGSTTGAKRINKADALQELKNVIAGVDPALVDDEIISKLTGKVAAYFTGILLTATKD